MEIMLEDLRIQFTAGYGNADGKLLTVTLQELSDKYEFDVFNVFSMFYQYKFNYFGQKDSLVIQYRKFAKMIS